MNKLAEQQIFMAAEILRAIVAAWRNGEMGDTTGGIMAAPSYVARAVILLDEIGEK